METIFKVGDKVFDIQFGWGEVRELISSSHFLVIFKDCEVSYYQDGTRFTSPLRTLSFTEYKFEGFSQERPVNYDQYIGKWGVFWDNHYEYKLICKFRSFDGNMFETEGRDLYHNFKPLTEEQIKMLEL